MQVKHSAAAVSVLTSAAFALLSPHLIQAVNTMNISQRFFHSVKWNEQKAADMAARNGLSVGGKSITLPKHRAVGIKVWGAIDYLVHNHGYMTHRES